jgi:hypothetical protein
VIPVKLSQRRGNNPPPGTAAVRTMSRRHPKIIIILAPRSTICHNLRS